MRVLALLPYLRVIVATVLLFGVTSSASAQDEFEDDFEDEFEEEETPPPPPAADDDDDAAADEFEDGDDDDDAEELPPADEGEDAAPAGASEELAAQRFRSHNTYTGSVGGIHILDAGSASVGSFRVQLATDFFFTSDFLVPGDNNDHIGGALSLSWTVHELVEVYASILAFANFNDKEDPQLFQTLGDTNLGVKVFTSVLPWLTIGGDLNLKLLNTVGDIGVVFASTSLGIRGLLTADLRQLESPVPFIARLSLQYFLDNSSQLIEDVENRRYAGLPPDMRAADPADEDSHLLTRVERFALNINRTDFFNIGIGLEAPLKVADDLELYVSPLLEWTWSIPVNRQGYDCLFIPGAGTPDEPVAGADGCLDRQGISAFAQTLTLGVRVLPPVRGLSTFMAVDIGVTGTGTFVRELAGNAPYNVLLGVGYAYDEPEPIVREVVREAPTVEAAPTTGRLIGIVVEQGPMTPIAGAVVRFPGRELTALSTADDGRFTTYALEPGEVQLEVVHPLYNPGTCSGTIAATGGDVEGVRCELVALPRNGSVEGRVLGENGTGVAATVNITGPATRTVNADPGGRFTVPDLPAGHYTAAVDSENYLLKQQDFDVTAQQATQLEITLVPRPRQPLVQVNARQISIRRQINFATDSAEILASSDALMTEIADVIIRNPDILRLEIQGHTDNTGAEAHNQELSSQRAESVRTWLTTHGVDAGRLEARGFGSSQPLVPNITPANRARNRRVQFIIRERSGGAGGGGGGGGE